MAIEKTVRDRKRKLGDITLADAKKAGQIDALYIVGFRAEVVKHGLMEDEIRSLLKEMASVGKCGDGTMCRIWT